MTCQLATPEATARFAGWLAPRLTQGDVLLLDGPVGAGKTHFARAVIQTRLAAAGTPEDVPSPTFTLVQVYQAGALEIWHADLFRLQGPSDSAELGLDEAFETALCLIEWPDRLPSPPPGAIRVHIEPQPDEARRLTLQADAPRWSGVLADARHWNA